MEMTESPRTTAVRDIKTLLKLGCIEKIEAQAGRKYCL